MPANYDPLNTAIQGMVAEVDSAVGIDNSTIAFLEGIETLITDALAKDNALDQANTDAATATVTAVFDKLKASNAALAAALAAHQTPPPPTP